MVSVSNWNPGHPSSMHNDRFNRPICDSDESHTWQHALFKHWWWYCFKLYGAVLLKKYCTWQLYSTEQKPSVVLIINISNVVNCLSFFLFLCPTARNGKFFSICFRKRDIQVIQGWDCSLEENRYICLVQTETLVARPIPWKYHYRSESSCQRVIVI